MPCGQRCKEIIDGWNALVMSGSCMIASILLTATTSEGPPDDLAEKFAEQSRQLAETAQAIASALTPSGRG